MQGVTGAGPIVTWIVVGLVLLALVGIAIGTAARRSGRAVRWHDEANRLADQGSEVVDAVRIWGQHSGAAGPQVWTDLANRLDGISASTRSLAQRATATRPRELAGQAGDTADSLRAAMAAHAQAQPDRQQAARTELLAAADELDRALAGLRTAV